MKVTLGRLRSRFFGELCCVCDTNGIAAGGNLCEVCSHDADLVIKRWVDSGDAPASIIMEMYQLSRAALDKRVERVKKRGVPPLRPPDERGGVQPARIPDHVRDEIRRLYVHDAFSQTRLAEKFGCTRSTVANILKEMGT